MFSILLIGCIAVASANDFQPVYQWKSVEYNFPNATMKRELIMNGKYVPDHNMPLGIHIWQNKMFITVPRWRNGVASNLNYISMEDTSQSPTLTPYPNWKANDISSPNGIVSIFRVRSDPCNRLWGVDTGLDDAVGDGVVIRPPRLIIIDLKTDKVIRRYTLPDSVQTSDSFFVDLAVDVDPAQCDDAHVYISDIGYGLVVYSWAKNDSWRFTHNFFGYDPLNGDFNVKGVNFQWKDGIFGLALTPPREDGSKTLYFHSMSGITEFSASTDVLKDKSAAEHTKYHDFHIVGTKGPLTQGASSLIDPTSNIEYFTQVNRNGIACWDTTRELNPYTFIHVAQDNETLVFPQDLTIEPNTGMLYVMSDNLQELLFTKYDSREFNFYVTAAPLSALEPICKSTATAVPL